MPEELRPDRSKVIFYEPDEDYLLQQVDLMVMEDPKQPGRWKSGPVGRVIADLRARGLNLCVVSGDRYTLLPRVEANRT